MTVQCEHCRLLHFRRQQSQVKRLLSRQQLDCTLVAVHHPSLEALETSASQGCKFCSVLWAALRQPHQLSSLFTGRFPSSADIRLYWSPSPNLDTPPDKFVVKCGVDRSGELRCKTDSSHPESGMKDQLNTVHNDNTTSQENFQSAHRWLQQCQDNHPNCFRYQDSIPQLPTRVLAVGWRNSQTVHLIQGNSVAPYATLSHRWGKATPITTTSSNLHERKQGILFTELPQTFQDAVIITREMGLRYLWIDSLCILQDSREDWNAEAARMGTYYWNSQFNIAAEDASDSTQGCFRESHSTSFRPCQIDIKFPVGFREKTMTLNVQPNLARDWRSFVPSQLDSRGWVFQERILALRTLSYGRFQISFCCMTQNASQTEPDGVGRQTTTGLLQEFQTLLRCPPPSPRGQANIFRPRFDYEYDRLRSEPNWEISVSWTPRTQRELAPYKQWHEIVKEYKRRDLTMNCDILPALSGIAWAFGRKNHSSYLAGMWDVDFRRSLLWRIDGSHFHTYLRLDPPCAPSWSWASSTSKFIEFTVSECISKDMAEICTIEDVKVSEPASEAYPPTVKGELRVRGFLLPVLVSMPTTKSAGPPEVIDPDSGQQLGDFTPDTWDVVGTPAAPKEPVLCLPILGFSNPGRGSENTKVSGRVLGLRLIQSGDVATYLRVGEGFLSLPWSKFDQAQRHRLVII